MRRLGWGLLGIMVLAGCGLESEEEGLDGPDESFLVDGKADTAGVVEGGYDARMILQIANRGSSRELTGRVRLPARVAENIVEYRKGDDGRLGTADDGWLDDLAELDAIPFVGPNAFRTLRAAARSDIAAAMKIGTPCAAGTWSNETVGSGATWRLFVDPAGQPTILRADYLGTATRLHLARKSARGWASEVVREDCHAGGLVIDRIGELHASCVSEENDLEDGMSGGSQKKIGRVLYLRRAPGGPWSAQQETHQTSGWFASEVGIGLSSWLEVDPAGFLDIVYYDRPTEPYDGYSVGIVSNAGGKWAELAQLYSDSSDKPILCRGAMPLGVLRRSFGYQQATRVDLLTGDQSLPLGNASWPGAYDKEACAGDSAGRIHALLWKTSDRVELEHVAVDGSRVTREVLVSSPHEESGGGFASDLALDGAGKVHVSYAIRGELHHKFQGPAGWLDEVVAHSQEDVYSTSIAIDTSGRVHIGYTTGQDAAAQMRYARRACR